MFERKCVVIAAGGGSFQPKRPPIAGIEAYEGKSVLYAVRKMDAFRGKRHADRRRRRFARSTGRSICSRRAALTLVHHRDDFRAAQHSVNQMRELVAAGKINFEVASVKALHGATASLPP